jgi:hypothetical protein
LRKTFDERYSEKALFALQKREKLNEKKIVLVQKYSTDFERPLCSREYCWQW